MSASGKRNSEYHDPPCNPHMRKGMGGRPVVDQTVRKRRKGQHRWADECKQRERKKREEIRSADEDDVDGKSSGADENHPRCQKRLYHS